MPVKILVQKFFILIKKKLFNLIYASSLLKLKINHKDFIKHDKSLSKLSNDIQKNLSNTYSSHWHIKSEAISRSQNFIKTKEFMCLGYGLVRIDENIDWHADHFHNFTWKNKYFDKIDYVAIDSECDVKVPWEISRFQYLLYLAEGYILDKNNQAYRYEFCSILDNWISKNKIGYGVNWVISMEVSIRAINLCLSLIIFWNDLSIKEKKRYLTLVFEHLYYLKLFPEISDVAGNHHLAGLMGIFIIESILLDKSSKKLQKSFETFSNEAKLQFESSGIHFERSPTYHRLCLDMIMYVLIFNERIGIQNNDLLKILKDGNDFSSLIANHSNEIPIIGDNDSGHIIWFGRSHRDYRNNFVALNIILNNECQNEFISSDSIWISAIAGKKIITAQDESVNKKYSFSGGGFLILSDNDLHAVMRVGSQGLKGRASHDHDDSLSLWLSFKGQDFLVEKGCHSYTLNQNKRLDYLTSMGHNLIQPLNNPRFKPSQGSIVKTVRGASFAQNWSINSESGTNNEMLADIVSKKHSKDPFKFHDRSVLLKSNENKIIVQDSLEWKDEFIGDQRWHFESSFVPKIQNKDKILFYKNSYLFCELQIQANQSFKIEIFNYDHSFHYGTDNKAYGIKVLFDKSLKIGCKSVFTFHKSV